MGPSQWVLEAVEGQYTGRRFRVTERGLTFGREADNDLVLLDDNISRHHALVRISGDHPVLEDRNSRNGTFVNNQRVSRMRLKEGDRIAVGTHLFQMRTMAEDEEPPEDSDMERTVIATPSPAHLRRTQAVQVFSPEALAYQNARAQRENLAVQPSPPPESVPPPPVVNPEEEKSAGPILGGAAAPAAIEAHRPQEHLDVNGPLVEGAARVTGGQVLSPEPQVPPAPGTAEPVLPPDNGPAQQPDIEVAAQGVVQDPGACDVEPVPDLPSGGSTKRLAVAGGTVAAVLIVAMAVYSRLSAPPESGPVAARPTPARVASAPENDAAAMFQWSDDDTSAPRTNAALTEEEKALPKAERVSLSNEHFDQAERYMESDKLMAALEEFEKALALNPSCRVCVIRISKVEAEIRREIEKYKSDALRSYQAMEYDKAKRYWEMVLELERDPAGRRVATDGLRKAIFQLKKQSYR